MAGKCVKVHILWARTISVGGTLIAEDAKEAVAAKAREILKIAREMEWQREHLDKWHQSC